MPSYWDYLAKAPRDMELTDVGRARIEKFEKAGDKASKRASARKAASIARTGKLATTPTKKVETPKKSWKLDLKLAKKVGDLLVRAGREVVGATEFGDVILSGDMVVRAVAVPAGRTVSAGAVREFREQCGGHAYLVLAADLIFYCDAIECAKAEGEKPITLLDSCGIAALKKR